MITAVLLASLAGLSALIPLHITGVNAVSWSAASQVPMNTIFNIRPSVTQDSLANFWLVYESSLTQQSYYKTFNGFAWTSELAFTASSGGKGFWYNIAPSIFTLSNGTIFLAWVSNRTGNPDVFYKTNTKGVWSQESQITNTIYQDADPSITQDLNGNIWLVWDRVFGATANLYYKTFSSTTGWSGEVQLTVDASADISPSATMTSDGRIWVTWSSFRTGNYQIWYKYFNGATWTADTRLTSYTLFDSDPAIVQTRDGTVWILWSREIKITNSVFGYDLYYQNSTNSGSSWSAVTAITTSGSSATGCGIDPCNNNSPSLLQSSDKKLYIFWSSDMPDASNFNIFYINSPQILIHELAVTSVKASPQKMYSGGLKSINQSALVSMNTTIANLGDYSETAQFKLYANSTLIASGNYSLLPSQTLTIYTHWNTTGIHPGCWGIKATLGLVSGEVNTSNNVLFWGYIHLLYRGDINQDGLVNILDAGVMAYDYGATVGSPRYNPYADINGDGIINILDVGVLSANYGTFTPPC